MVLPLVVLIAGASLSSFYGIHSAVVDALFNGRSSTYDILQEALPYKIRKSYQDYPSLKNREEIDFKQGGDSHHAYFYEAESPKGMILLAHGYGSLSDGQEASLADYFLRDHWSVFQIDLTASGKDDDSSSKGFVEGPGDISETIHYIESQERFAQYSDSLCLMGYSWGAYSVAASLSEDYRFSPKAMASFSGFDSPAGEMFGLARHYVGFLADIVKPLFDLGMYQSRGSKSFRRAVNGINHAENCKVMLVQGEKDETVFPDSTSIWHFADEIQNKERLTLYGDALLPRDHTSIWYSDEAYEYYSSKALADYQKLISDYGSEKDIPEEEIAYIKEKASTVDESLLSSISSMFELAVA